MVLNNNTGTGDDSDTPPSNPPPAPPIDSNERTESMSSFQSIDLKDNHQSNNRNHTNDQQNDKNVIQLDSNLDPPTKTEKNENNTLVMVVKDDKEKKNKDDQVKSVSFFKLFRYASTLDKIFIGCGIFFAFSLGLGFPSIILVMGHLTDIFVEYDIFHQFATNKPPGYDTFYEQNLTNINNVDEFYNLTAAYYNSFDDKSDFDQLRSRTGLSVEHIVNIFNDSIFHNGTLYVDNFRTDSGLYALYMALIAIGFGILDYFALGLWEQAARNQVYRIKLLFFRSIIHQDIAWFDTKASGDFASKLTNDLNLVQQGMGDKVALTIMSFSTLIFSICIAFYHGWELTLVTMSIMPVLGIAFAVIGKVQVKFAASESNAYGKAGAIAEEVFNLIRTVHAFGGQQKEIERYNKNIEPARRNGIRRSMFTGISLGIMYFAIYSSYGLSFWYGARLIVRSIKNGETPPKYQASNMLIVFFNVLMGAFSLGQTSPYFEAIGRACGAFGNIFQIIQQKPKIDSLSQLGKRVQIRGRVQFRNVHFNYPSRPEVSILNGINLDAEPGQTIGIAGSSGNGKSTIMQLIQRFYDTNKGQVLIDGHDIKDLNVGSLRDQIGVVGQEPVLFGYSIEKNIAFGHPEANFEEVVQAAKEANAYDFIQNLPDKFNTLVGERGAQLSGGQKQRIAIARALIRRPKILLLDESTSALDSESEKIVQAALDRASIGRTTFIVAHRLSTIRNADKILVLDQGRVKESGTHQELIDAKGIYYNMARLQNQDEEQEQRQLQDGIRKRSIAYAQRSKSIDTVQTSISSAHGNEDGPNNDEKSLEQESLPLRRLIRSVMPDRCYLITATIFSFIVGLSIPVFSFIFGEVLGVLAAPDPDYILDHVLKYALIFLAMGIISGILQFLQSYLYGISSENLTYRMRNDVFRAILSQEVAWFDQPENTTGALCARLSSDASAVQGATGSRLSVMAQTVSILTAGIVISMFYCWKLSLVMLCFVPVILISVYFQMKIIMGMNISKRKVSEEATKIAVEAISNIRTVASLHLELTFWINYQTALDVDFRKSRLEPHIKSFTFGFTQMSFNVAYAVALFYGSRLIIQNELSYSELFKSTEAVLFGTNMIGQSVAFSSDYQKGKIAAIAIFRLLDRIPTIVVNSIFGDKPNECKGELAFKEVEFRYPTRLQVRVLKGIEFEVCQGETVALVGESGCGKSTCMQILEHVFVDDHNIHQLNIAWLRSQIGIVSQEPVLFDKTIAENIAYGDNSRLVDQSEIVRASQTAYIHDFIQSLPKGYDTSVGDKGAQLSGGQKQRIAIARALIRDPKILLLDEATSALDSESEKAVQKALDEARKGRTCLVIAHRLSTIRDVDRILVIQNGRVVEQGTHDQLIERRRIYYQMYTAQCAH
ncbi:multidrug resistance protein 1-like [Dermatophagoides farinae]|uniref:ABC-type xenobiotic transporter n=1 Tax=Dermatophagoides farinae TaxID=6954 RepID=A0A9D4SCI1_DERFA|nr:multidrug resistance protein 1-like [Dermatophagoides farinae]